MMIGALACLFTGTRSLLGNTDSSQHSTQELTTIPPVSMLSVPQAPPLAAQLLAPLIPPHSPPVLSPCTPPHAPPPVLPPPAPPPSPPPHPPYLRPYTKGILTTGMCDGMLRDTHHKFWTMWASTGYVRRAAGEMGCWGEDEEQYFARVGTGAQCDVNWYEGCHDLEEGDDRPWFSAEAPALLGSEESINAFCSSAGHQRRQLSSVEAAFQTTTQDRKASMHRELRGDISGKCIASNNNVLRLLTHAKPWNMCQNLEWLMCAAKGLLPGQGSRKMHFADAPGALDTHNDFWDGDQWVERYHVGDVYYLEICILSQLCENSHELFTIDAGAYFVCDLRPARFAELRAILTTPRVAQ